MTTCATLRHTSGRSNGATIERHAAGVGSAALDVRRAPRAARADGSSVGTSGDAGPRAGPRVLAGVLRTGDVTDRT